MSAEIITRPPVLTADAVRATLYADYAELESDPEVLDDGPDELTKAMGYEANFIVDRYARSEGWDTTAGEIRRIHDELVAIGIAAARSAMVELAARRLAGTRRVAP
ncbi:MAG: hypothetical protein ABSE58_06125 [Candidatus Limnocylindrales bacterium]|jgi:hypothetical protein